LCSFREPTTSLTVQLPDTLTSFHLTAFALSPTNGLGITPTPIVITTFKPFFIDYNLPYAVTQGDEVKITVSIHNYFELKSKVTVNIANTLENFQVLSVPDIVRDVEPYSVHSVQFTIKTKDAGLIPIKVNSVHYFSSKKQIFNNFFHFFKRFEVVLR
jgi:CD109 antigen